MKNIVMQDIIQAIAQELKSLFPKVEIYEEGLIQGYEEPCFFIDFEKEDLKKQIGNRYSNLSKLRVVYFQDFNEENAKYKVYKIRDALIEGFNIITYKEMHFKIKNKEIKIDDKDLVFSFEIQVFTKKEIKEDSMFNSIEKLTEREK